MAVEARHLNLFLPQSLAVENVQSYGTSAANAPNPAKNGAVKKEGGVTYYVAKNDTRKRRRDDGAILQPDYRGSSSPFGDDLAFHVHQQQLDIDRLIAQHTEGVRIEIEERRRRYTKQMAQALSHHLKKKIVAKEEELSKITKLNAELEERVKFLTAENQMWRELAQTKEAAADSIRRNLEQALSEKKQKQHRRHVEDDGDDDARSSCGSNYVGEEYSRRTMCRRCGREPPSVVVLPCRHLCLCAACGSSAHLCPVCHSIKTSSVHVNVFS